MNASKALDGLKPAANLKVLHNLLFSFFQQTLLWSDEPYWRFEVPVADEFAEFGERVFRRSFHNVSG
jgi:hypothetical protein